MDPFTGVMLGTMGANMLGGLFQQDANQRATDNANNLNWQQANNNRAWQEWMSNTAYRRAMDDMKAAGLNPMLAFSQGGASSPSGSSYNAQAARYDNVLGNAVNSGVDAMSKKGQLDLGKEGLGIQAGTLQNAQAQTQISKANSQADIALKAAQASQSLSSAKKAETESQILASKAKREKLEGDFYGSEAGKTYFYLDKVNNAVNGSLESANSAFKLINPFKQGKELLKPGRGMMRDGTKFNTSTGEVIP